MRNLFVEPVTNAPLDEESVRLPRYCRRIKLDVKISEEYVGNFTLFFDQALRLPLRTTLKSLLDCAFTFFR